jgi:hypothetical protein
MFKNKDNKKNIIDNYLFNKTIKKSSNKRLKLEIEKIDHVQQNKKLKAGFNCNKLIIKNTRPSMITV